VISPVIDPTVHAALRKVLQRFGDHEGTFRTSRSTDNGCMVNAVWLSEVLVLAEVPSAPADVIEVACLGMATNDEKRERVPALVAALNAAFALPSADPDQD
jgi:hypothetical protein